MPDTPHAAQAATPSNKQAGTQQAAGDAAPARPPLSGHVRGKTLDFSWDSGPTAGKTQRHVFHRDGTVEWSSVGESAGRAASGGTPPDKPEYAAIDVGDDVCLVSYRSSNGYTLTVALDFATGLSTAIASNSDTWMPVGGRFREVS